RSCDGCAPGVEACLTRTDSGARVDADGGKEHFRDLVHRFSNGQRSEPCGPGCSRSLDLPGRGDLSLHDSRPGGIFARAPRSLHRSHAGAAFRITGYDALGVLAARVERVTCTFEAAMRPSATS